MLAKVCVYSLLALFLSACGGNSSNTSGVLVSDSNGGFSAHPHLSVNGDQVWITYLEHSEKTGLDAIWAVRMEDGEVSERLRVS